MTKHIVLVENSATGAGEVAYEIARKKNYRLTLLARDPGRYMHIPGQGTVECVNCDTNDLEAMLKVARDIDAKHPIDGITTLADFFVPQASYLANNFGTPSLNYEAAMGVRNKYFMRKTLQRTVPGLNPAFHESLDIRDAKEFARENGFPVIAKPQNWNDSIDVKRIENEAQLEEYFEHAKTWTENSAGQKIIPRVLLEGYIVGREFSVETVQAKGGNRELIGVTSNVLTGLERGHFAELAAYFPHRGEEAEILFGAVSQALDALTIDCGVIHTECRIEQGRVKIIEVNPRLIGDMVGSHVIACALGVNPVEAVLDIAVGEHRGWKPTKQEGGGICGVVTEKAGIFEGFSNLDEVTSMPGIRFVKVLAQSGSLVKPPSSNGDILALIIAQHRDPLGALDLARQAAMKCCFRISESAASTYTQGN